MENCIVEMLLTCPFILLGEHGHYPHRGIGHSYARLAEVVEGLNSSHGQNLNPGHIQKQQVRMLVVSIKVNT